MSNIPRTSWASDSAARTPGSLGGRASKVLLLIVATWVVPAVLQAGTTCTVPGSHATVQAALADVGCDEVQLAAQSYNESIRIERSVTLAGVGGSILAGRLTAAGSGVVAVVSGLAVQNSCLGGSLRSMAGARLQASAVAVSYGSGFGCPPEPAEIFADGFETGDTSRWNGGTVPP